MNPILQALTSRQNSNSMMDTINMVSKAANGNPNALFDRMMQSNPQFKSFVEQNQGKTPEQIAKENGIDINAVLRMMR